MLPSSSHSDQCLEMVVFIQELSVYLNLVKLFTKGNMYLHTIEPASVEGKAHLLCTCIVSYKLAVAVVCRA